MMSPVVMKMLTDVYMVDIQREIEHQRNVENAGSRGPWILTVAALLVAAVIGSVWIA